MIAFPTVAEPVQAVMQVDDLTVVRGDTTLLDRVSFQVYPKEVLVLVGAPGSGRAMALEGLARLGNLIRRGGRVKGDVRLHGLSVLEPTEQWLARRVVWVPSEIGAMAASIYELVAYDAQRFGYARNRGELADLVEHSLRRVSLWPEVKDLLHQEANRALPRALWRRLNMARAVAIEPEVLVLEPSRFPSDSAEIAIESQVFRDLKAHHAIVLAQDGADARHYADRVAFFHDGRMLETGPARGFYAGPETAEARAFLNR